MAAGPSARRRAEFSRSESLAAPTVAAQGRNHHIPAVWVLRLPRRRLYGPATSSNRTVPPVVGGVVCGGCCVQFRAEIEELPVEAASGTALVSVDRSGQWRTTVNRPDPHIGVNQSSRHDPIESSTEAAVEPVYAGSDEPHPDKRPAGRVEHRDRQAKPRALRVSVRDTRRDPPDTRKLARLLSSLLTTAEESRNEDAAEAPKHSPFLDKTTEFDSNKKAA